MSFLRLWLVKPSDSQRDPPEAFDRFHQQCCLKQFRSLFRLLLYILMLGLEAHSRASQRLSVSRTARIGKASVVGFALSRIPVVIFALTAFPDSHLEGSIFMQHPVSLLRSSTT